MILFMGLLHVGWENQRRMTLPGRSPAARATKIDGKCDRRRSSRWRERTHLETISGQGDRAGIAGVFAGLRVLHCRFKQVAVFDAAGSWRGQYKFPAAQKPRAGYFVAVKAPGG
jgi:hypothetical protein